MRTFLLLLLACVHILASIQDINSFDADFTQSITDEKEKILLYKGHISAAKPQNARWSYKEPIKKDVYINGFEVTIVEPELEQVIIKRIESSFDFFKIISNAKKIDSRNYSAYYKDTRFTIIQKDGLISSISYIDEFENKVTLTFENQKQNLHVDKALFMPSYPLDFDILKD